MVVNGCAVVVSEVATFVIGIQSALLAIDTIVLLKSSIACD